jgi:hypothetical protein
LNVYRPDGDFALPDRDFADDDLYFHSRAPLSQSPVFRRIGSPASSLSVNLINLYSIQRLHTEPFAVLSGQGSSMACELPAFRRHSMISFDWSIARNSHLPGSQGQILWDENRGSKDKCRTSG